MGIRFVKTDTFKRTVKVKIMSPDRPDQHAHGTFIANYRRPSMEELEQLTAVNNGEQESRLSVIRDVLSKQLASVEGIDAEDGSKLSESEQLDIVMNAAEFTIPAHVEFWRAINSMAEVKRGN